MFHTVHITLTVELINIVPPHFNGHTHPLKHSRVQVAPALNLRSARVEAV